MSCLGFQISRGARTTISPPISIAQDWGRSYNLKAPLLSMHQGVPQRPPPDTLLESLSRESRAEANATYGFLDGEPALRAALALEMKTVYGKNTSIDTEDVAITAGCNLAFTAVIMAIADAGQDEVILPSPWYFNHEMSLSLLGIHRIVLPTRPEDDFIPSVEQCAALLTPRTKAIVLVTPNNPTGVVYSPETIDAFAKLAHSANIALILDETYRDFVRGGPPHHLFDNASWRSNVVHLFSFSKSYHIPGHRLGAIVSAPELMVQIHKVLDTVQICPGKAAQVALTENLPFMRKFIQNTSSELHAKHLLFRKELPASWRIAGVGGGSASIAAQGYFAFVRHPFKGVSSMDVCMRLSQEKGVITLPASFFVAEGEVSETTDRWIRFSVANIGEKSIQQVCARLCEAQHSFNWEVEGEICV